MYLTEFNEERAIRGWKQDGIEEGMQRKAVEAARNLLKMNLGTPEQIAEAEGLPLEQVLALQKELAAQTAN